MNQQDNLNLQDRMEKFESAIKQGFQELKQNMQGIENQIQALQKDTDTLTEGDSRHRVLPVRDEIAHIQSIADQAHRRIDHILWIVAGISLGSGIGGSVALKILFGI